MFFFSLCQLLSGEDVAEGQGGVYTDPRTPYEAVELNHANDEVPVLFYEMKSQMEAIQRRIQDVKKRLADLPPMQTPAMANAFGYHSDYLPVSDVMPEQPRWTMNLDMDHDAGALDLVLVPAQDQRSAGAKNGYAFPKRFRIVGARGKVYVDWTQADFPDPGLRPVYFHMPDFKSRNVTIQVFTGHKEGEVEFFSLARVYMIRKNEVRFIKRMNISSSFESKPYWSQDYLNHPSGVLGLPLGKKVGTPKGLLLPMEASRLPKPLLVEIDLGRNVKAGWVNFLPAKSPDSMLVPGYGFPGKLQIETIQTGAGRRGKKSGRILGNTQIKNPGNNMLRIPGYGESGRFLRIYCNDFPSYQGQAVFSLSEIIVQWRGEVLSAQAPIKLSIGGEPLDVDASMLVDGKSYGREHVYLTDWYQQLAMGKRWESELKLEQKRYSQLENRWGMLMVWTKGITLSLLVLAVVVGFVLLLVGRRRQNLRLRKQISSDLHDDVGSKVAAISLASTYVKQQASEPRVKERGERIHAIVQDMHQSLRDVLWLTDRQTDSLVELIQKLADSARKRVASERLSLEVTPMSSLPKRSVGVQTKRDILLFFKEAVHNATIHSKASSIRIGIKWEARTLKLTIRDNGEGFTVPSDEEVEESSSMHHGLMNMRDRAKRLKAGYTVISGKDKGASVSLEIPIR